NTLQNTKAYRSKESLREIWRQISKEEAEKVVVAYEPIWAIGTGKNATKEIAEDTIASIRSVLKGLFGEQTAEKIRILYGGSVKPNNIAEYMSEKDIDGALVGGASLALDSYRGLIENLVK
ncbi:MAG TPA: triose-phosphate isomerase, partial [Firmicutes bacterium]|nr:triose-phosphate isomerase [Bacillota bacterium]